MLDPSSLDSDNFKLKIQYFSKEKIFNYYKKLINKKQLWLNLSIRPKTWITSQVNNPNFEFKKKSLKKLLFLFGINI